MLGPLNFPNGELEYCQTNMHHLLCSDDVFHSMVAILTGLATQATYIHGQGTENVGASDRPPVETAKLVEKRVKIANFLLVASCFQGQST